MNTPGYGWIFQKLGIGNPAGFFLRHKLVELGLSKTDVVERIGIDPEVLSEIVDGLDPELPHAFQFDPKFSELIVKQEKARPELVPIMNPVLYGPRARALPNGLALLTSYAGAPASDMTPAQRFDLAARRQGMRVYLDAMWLFGEAVWLAAGMFQTRMPFDQQIAMRRRFGRLVAKVDTHPDRDAAFAGEAQQMAKKGDLWGAINLAADRLEALEIPGALMACRPRPRSTNEPCTFH